MHCHTNIATKHRLKKTAYELAVFRWLGWQDLNSRMRESKSLALPLGDIPTILDKGMVEPISSGAFEGIRTPDPRLRRAMLYPTELQTQILERAMGIGPT